MRRESYAVWCLYFAAVLLLAGPASVLADPDGSSTAVHVSSVKDEADAKAEEARFEASGFPAVIRHEEVPDQGHWYRIYVGPFAMEESALEAAEDVLTSGLSNYARVVAFDGGAPDENEAVAAAAVGSAVMLTAAASADDEPDGEQADEEADPEAEPEEEGDPGAEGEEEEEEEEPLPLSERPRLSVAPIASGFVYGASMSGAAWDVDHEIENLLTVEPEEGEDPNGQTIVKVLANHSDIIVGVRCYDPDPSGIVSYSKARDTDLEEEDHVIIVFDTFLDGRTGHVFAVNPTGARFDGLVVARAEINSNWDTIWDARTAIDSQGWTAVFRIPAKSLSFKRGATEWGFNVQRRVQRLQETSRWSGASQDFDLSQTSRAGILADLPELDYGVGLSVRPAAVGSVTKEAGEDDEWDGDLSLDVTQKLGPGLTASLTVNTDFAETEVDARQVNLSRFDLFFPEKRAFFLEGAEVFEFGSGLDEEILLPLFTRNIGLVGVNKDEDQFPIPINAGGKINGYVGDNTNLGALVVNTRKQDGVELEDEEFHDIDDATMGAARIRHNILEESSIGVIGAFGDPGRLLEKEIQESPDEDPEVINVFEQDSDSWMAGFDFLLQTSNFMDEKNLFLGGWAVMNDRQDLEGDKSAYGLTLEYPNDLFDIAFKSVRIGAGFDPSLGFTPRNDVHIWDFATEFNPRPQWSFLRQMVHEVGFTLYNDWNNSDWKSYAASIAPIDWLLESGDQISFGIEWEGDRLHPARGGGDPEIFEISGGVDLLPGTYEWHRFVSSARTAPKRRLSAQVIFEWGDFYNGTLTVWEGTISYRPSAFVTFELTGERNRGKKFQALPDDADEIADEMGIPIEEVPLWTRGFTEEVIGARVQFNFTPEIQLASFTQYQFDNEAKELGTNNRLRWTFDRVGDLFVVYNHNWIRESKQWNFVSRELPIKVQYNWRF